MVLIRFVFFGLLLITSSQVLSETNKPSLFKNRSIFSLKKNEESNIYTASNILLILSLYNYMTKSSIPLSRNWLTFEGKNLVQNGDLEHFEKWPLDVKTIVSIAQFSQGKENNIKKAIKTQGLSQNVTLKNIMRDKPWQKNKIKNQLASKILTLPEDHIKREVLLVQNYITQKGGKTQNLGLKNNTHLELVWHELPEVID